MFINCPEGSNNIYFENPNPHVEFNYRLDEKNNPRSEGMHEYWYFEPMDGDHIIFPHGCVTDQCINQINQCLI